jgi:adenine/guanine/hypoxanthine permease
VLTFFGFMHGEEIGFGETPVVAVAYLAVAAFLFGCAKYATVTASEPTSEHAVPGVPAPAE